MKRLRITVNGISYDVEVEVLEDDSDSFPLNGPLSAPIGMSATTAAPPAMAPAPARPAPAPRRDGVNLLTSPIAGIVVEVRVSVGDTVKENDPLVVIEAMKMNTNVSSPTAGKIKAIHIKASESVRQGQPLLEFE